jgi:hypothetical protein
MKGKSTFTPSESKAIIDLINLKVKTLPAEQKKIRAKIRQLGFYASDFGLSGGYTSRDFTNAVTINGSSVPVKAAAKAPAIKKQTNPPSADRDEHYIIGLCEEVLKCKSSRQHKFDFLKGDSGRKLPVDAFFSNLNLVIEYHERQHTEAVFFFDKRITVSNITRGEQRKKYDQLRRSVLPKQQIRLIEFDYHEFGHSSRKRLIRNKKAHLKIISEKLRLAGYY